MKQHISTIHYNEKSYQCEQCGKKFGHTSHLKQHILTHTTVTAQHTAASVRSCYDFRQIWIYWNILSWSHTDGKQLRVHRLRWCMYTSGSGLGHMVILNELKSASPTPTHHHPLCTPASLAAHAQWVPIADGGCDVMLEWR